ncbi:MAG: aromatic ring-opening dioxygenase LigA [Propionicimonas sp.]
MATATANGSKVRLIGLIAMILGAVFIVAGITTWGMVSSKLAAEKITVSGDAPAFAGATVADPFTAFVQADVINHHALQATNGKTYAELDKEDPLRATAMNGSFLRASLFTSVIAFGVALFAIGVGALSILLGWGMRLAGSSSSAAAESGAERAVA